MFHVLVIVRLVRFQSLVRSPSLSKKHQKITILFCELQILRLDSLSRESFLKFFFTNGFNQAVRISLELISWKIPDTIGARDHKTRL